MLNIDLGNFNLKINNLAIYQNTINFIIGRVGSGKTAFLNALLNELDIRKDLISTTVNELTNSLN